MSDAAALSPPAAAAERAALRPPRDPNAFERLLLEVIREMG